VAVEPAPQPEPVVEAPEAAPIAVAEAAPVAGSSYDESETKVLFDVSDLAPEAEATPIVEEVGPDADATAAYDAVTAEDVSAPVEAVESGAATMSFEAYDAPSEAPVAAAEEEPEATRMLSIAEDVEAAPEPTAFYEAVPEPAEASVPTMAFEAVAAEAIAAVAASPAPSAEEPASTDTIAMVAVDDPEKKKRKKRHR
jgi:hypothetical protein